MKKVYLKTKNMHCQSCSFLIESELSELEGVVKAESSYKKEETVVLYDENKTTLEKIMEVIKKINNYEISLIRQEYE